LGELVADKQQLTNCLKLATKGTMKRGEFALIAAGVLKEFGENKLKGPVSRPAIRQTTK
jgi:hypothetical protein